MNNIIFSFIKYLSNLGTNSKLPISQNKIVRYVNIICIFWYFAFILTSILSYSVGENFDKGILVNSTGFCIILTCHILNKFEKLFLASFGLLLHTIAYYFIVTTYMAPQRFVEFFYLLIPSVSLIFYNKYIYSWIIFGICVVLFHYTFIFLDFYNSEGVLFLPPLMFFLFLMNFLIVFYFKKLNMKNEKLLAEQRDQVLSDKIILQNQETELRELNEFKSHFFINLSHEIRTPITLIKGYTSKIDFKKTEAFNNQQMLVVNEQLDQIQSIVNTIMDLGKMDESKLILNIKQVSLYAFINKIYATFKNIFDNKNIDFSIDLPSKDFLIKIDEYQMERSVSNLLNNAYKFTNTGGKVVFYAKYINDLEIGVFDNGLGISKEDINKIFDRFYQSKNHITESQGSGIGLSFTKNIIEEHGFLITVESTLNIETTFKIIIPKTYISKQINIEPKLLSSNIKGKILIMDDHEQMRNYLKSLLPGANTIEAENGLQAQQIVKTEKIDLIITDYMMPIMNGYEFVTNIKKLGYKTPIIVITARADDKGKLDMLRLGIDAYLTKPFLEEEFTYSVNKSLQLYENIISSEKRSSSEEIKDSDENSEAFHKTIFKIISEKYNNPNFGIDDLAETLNISKRTLNRKTKLLLGQTPNQLIIEVRLQKAMEIKEIQPNVSKRQLAKMVGLTNANYLSKRLEIRFGQETRTT